MKILLLAAVVAFPFHPMAYGGDRLFGQSNWNKRSGVVCRDPYILPERPEGSCMKWINSYPNPRAADGCTDGHWRSCADGIKENNIGEAEYEGQPAAERDADHDGLVNTLDRDDDNDGIRDSYDHVDNNKNRDVIIHNDYPRKVDRIYIPRHQYDERRRNGPIIILQSREKSVPSN